jgi:hypothetical protein
LTRQLRQAIPCRVARRNFDHRGNRKLSRQSANEQIAANALVPKRCRSPAPGPLRGLQWNALLRVGTSLSTTRQPERASGQRGIIPQSLDTPDEYSFHSPAAAWNVLCGRPSRPRGGHVASGKALTPAIRRPAGVTISARWGDGLGSAGNPIYSSRPVGSRYRRFLWSPLKGPAPGQTKAAKTVLLGKRTYDNKGR